MKKPTSDHETLLSEVATVQQQIANLTVQRDEVSNQRRQAKVKLADLGEQLDKARLGAARALNIETLLDANGQVTALEKDVQQLTQIESNCTAAIADLDQQILDAKAGVQTVINAAKVRTFERLKSELPLDAIHRLYGLYRILPTGGYHWTYFLSDAGLVEPIVGLDNLESEWVKLFRVEESA